MSTMNLFLGYEVVSHPWLWMITKWTPITYWIYQVKPNLSVLNLVYPCSCSGWQQVGLGLSAIAIQAVYVMPKIWQPSPYHHNLVVSDPEYDICGDGSSANHKPWTVNPWLVPAAEHKAWPWATSELYIVVKRWQSALRHQKCVIQQFITFSHLVAQPKVQWLLSTCGKDLMKDCLIHSDSIKMSVTDHWVNMLMGWLLGLQAHMLCAHPGLSEVAASMWGQCRHKWVRLYWIYLYKL